MAQFNNRIHYNSEIDSEKGVLGQIKSQEKVKLIEKAAKEYLSIVKQLMIYGMKRKDKML